MNKVKAIVTQLDGTKEYSFEALSSMKKLRLLCIYGPDYSDGSDPVDCDGLVFSYNLQYLEWGRFPCTKLPSNFKSRNLVQLKLPGSELRRLWNNGIKVNFLCQFIEHCL